MIRQPAGLRGSVTRRWGQAHEKRGIIAQFEENAERQTPALDVGGGAEGEDVFLMIV